MSGRDRSVEPLRVGVLGARGRMGMEVCRTVDAAALFVMIGAEPNKTWFPEDIELDEWGYVKTGRDAIEAFLPTGPMAMPRRFVPVEANGQVAFGTYLLEDGRFRANAIHLIDFRGERVSEIVAFLDRDVFREFGLPFYLD